MITMSISWRARASRAAPRLAAGLWAGYTLTRTIVYATSDPEPLAHVAHIIPLWAPWAVVTVMLLAGALVPPWGSPPLHRVARLLRQWGMTITLTLLSVWALAFLMTDWARGWDVAASYTMLAAFALISGVIASREVAAPRAVVAEEDLHAGA